MSWDKEDLREESSALQRLRRVNPQPQHPSQATLCPEALVSPLLPGPTLGQCSPCTLVPGRLARTVMGSQSQRAMSLHLSGRVWVILSQLPCMLLTVVVEVVEGARRGRKGVASRSWSLVGLP